MKNTQSIERFKQQALNAWKRLSEEEKKYYSKEQAVTYISFHLKEIYNQPFQKRKELIKVAKEKAKSQKITGSLAYIMIKTSTRSQRRMDKILTKRDLFKRFREEYPSLYAKYNSYMYRQSFSSANYFYQNVELEYSGKSSIDAYLDLPGQRYNILEISFNYSSKDFFASMY